MNAQYPNELLELLLDAIDIPPSHYKLAAERYQSLGEWFHRPESRVFNNDPSVHPQGSFRYGTVIRPLLPSEEYDLDLVVEIELAKQTLRQKDLKELIGHEIKAYADAHNFKNPPREKRRCWRLDYADHVKFHMDILPAVPEDEAFKRQLVLLGVPEALAVLAVAITDIDHPNFSRIDDDWPRSNPRGFAAWFESRMRQAAEARMRRLVECRAYASVDDVPPYEWKTPLQRAIQILKRHRDVMFLDDPDGKPISMIITTAAAHGYAGETDLFEALTNAVERMPACVRNTRPRVPNPVNPGEDFADKWHADPQLEKNFREWQAQVTADVRNLPSLTNPERLQRYFDRKFSVNVSDEQARKLTGAVPAAVAPSAAPAVAIKTAPKPWKSNG